MASATALLAPPALMAAAPDDKRRKATIIPPYLKQGDLVGITCPAGFITEKDIQASVTQIESWGLGIIKGSTVGKRDFTFGGTDEERAADFQQLLDNPAVKAILCARGGYGVVRMIDRLEFSAFKRNPKWVIGFSDVTVFHNHLHQVLGVASLHSKMCNSFPEDWSKAEPVQVETILSIKQALMGETMRYTVNADLKNRPGVCEGELVGGNLKMLETLAGTQSDISTKGKILFVEDVGEALYNIDRMFCNLLRTGKLAQLKGLIIGGFTNIKAETPGDEFGRTLYDIVWEKIKQFNYPVCFGFPVGHQKNNYALKCGVKHKLTVDGANTILEEI